MTHSPHSVARPRRAVTLIAALVTLTQVTAGCTGQRTDDRAVVPPTESTRVTQTAPATGTGLLAPDDTTDDGMPPDLVEPTGSAAGPPAAAVLPWLAGAAIDDGILLDGTDGQRWHGRNARESAEIAPDGSYRYFGPDGSLVGCSAAGACVGVGADGTVAILAGRDQPRRVFAADGSDLGWFAADGEVAAAPAVAEPTASESGSASGSESGSAGDEGGDGGTGATEPSEATEPAEPAEATEPTEPAEAPASPAEPTDPTDPAETTESTAPDGQQEVPPATEALAAATNLESALATSGVDLAGLLDEGTLRPPFAGGVTGDPHIVTAGGTRYSTQDLGQYLARGGGDGPQIQLEFGAMAHRHDVSIVTAVAVDTGSEVITVTASGVVGTDGSNRAPTTSFDQIVMVDGVVIGRWPADDSGAAAVVIWFPDGSEVTATTHAALGITLIAALPSDEDAKGLFGNGRLQAVAGQDLLPRNGQPGTSVAGTVATWRVSGTDRLFGEPAAVTGSSAAAVVDPAARATAQTWCTGRGMTRSQDVNACVFDVAVTGDTSFVPGHLALARASAADRAPGAFAVRWPALQSGPRAVATALPSDGRVDTTIAPGGMASYRLTVDRPGSVTVVSEVGCAEGVGTPGMDEPGLRLFDSGGHAVSERAPWCGHLASDRLPKGEYLLVAANGQGRTAAHLRVDVQTP